MNKDTKRKKNISTKKTVTSNDIKSLFTINTTWKKPIKAAEKQFQRFPTYQKLADYSSTLFTRNFSKNVSIVALAVSNIDSGKASE